MFGFKNGILQPAANGLKAWICRDNHQHKGVDYCYEDLKGFGGVFWAEHYGPKGNFIRRFKFHNGITDLGMNHVLDVTFHGTSANGTWYGGLIDNSGYTALAAADTMASHAGWNEFTTYSESVRQTWVEGAASSRAMTNSTAMTFSISGSGTLRGAFLASDSTKSGTSGVLFATGLFGSTYPVTNGDSFKLIYTLSG